MLERLAIGVDLGATKIESALVRADGSVASRRQTSTRPKQGASRVLDRISDEILSLSTEADSEVLGIGVGAPGRVDRETGVVLESVNLGWSDVGLVDELTRRLQPDVPIHLQTDTVASALGESYYGAGRGCSSLVYLSIGTGFGGGVVCNGKVLTGAHGLAGSVGHFSLDPGGLPCSCGLTGCPETVVSGDGLLHVVREHSTARTHSSEGTSDHLSAEAVVQAAKRGDELSRAALEQMGHVIGTIMALYVTLVDPARFVIGGGLGLAAFDLLKPAAQAELQRRVLPPYFEDLDIQPSGLTSSAVGAACLVWAADPPPDEEHCGPARE